MNNRVNSVAKVRIFHAATIERPVDIYINDQQVISGLEYGEVTEYLPLEKGRYNVKIYDSENGDLLYNQTIMIDGDKYLTISAISETGQLKLVVLEDEVANRKSSLKKRKEDTVIKKVQDRLGNTIEVVVDQTGEIVEDAIDETGNIMVHAGDRIKRVIDRVGNVYEVVVNQSGKIIAKVISDLGNVVEGLVNRIGNTVKKTVDQFGNTVEVVVDGLENTVGWVIDELGDIVGETASDLSNLANGTTNEYVDLNEDTEFGFESMIPDFANNRVSHKSNDDDQAQVRFVHLSPNAPAVDITLPDGTKLFVDTAYKEVTDYIPVGAGTVDLQVRPTGTNQVALRIPNVIFDPGQMYTVYAIGLLNGNPPLEAILFEDQM
ncbi:DUF4397 domain-containing protein [Haloplasma contractile]|uniref:LPXTG-motif cell wall anchor domain protein n=1 Tax=Haloplasma contractile SSD-17B TaxID=1033810 RepID=F7Q0U3_9MOLU|nr:DUF4397 domain-containing protein [Haloplasma contractile]ERJ11317.1 LPXTG-motif cell wall anchor domain protein [Haloplasma contractile SSD-17B]